PSACLTLSAVFAGAADDCLGIAQFKSLGARQTAGERVEYLLHGDVGHGVEADALFKYSAHVEVNVVREFPGCVAVGRDLHDGRDGAAYGVAAACCKDDQLAARGDYSVADYAHDGV